MNSKHLLVLALLSGTALVSNSVAQAGGGGGGAGGAGGAGGSGAGSGAAGSGAAGSAGATAGGSSATGASAAANGSTTGATAAGSATTVGTGASSTAPTAGTGGVPNMSPTMPSRSALDTATAAGATGQNTSSLPPGIQVVPKTPGVSPLSGLRTEEVPAVSAGTRPIGPQPTTTETGTVASSTGSTTVPTTPTADAAAIAQRGGAVSSATTRNTGAETVSTAPLGRPVPIEVAVPPPATQQEIAPARTSPNDTRAWVPGHYSWNGSQWTWSEGAWQQPPTPNATWVPGSFDAQTRRWTEGYWQPSAATTER